MLTLAKYVYRLALAHYYHYCILHYLLLISVITIAFSPATEMVPVVIVNLSVLILSTVTEWVPPDTPGNRKPEKPVHKITI